jgi:ubiquitin carboxyl-terminal hydrolase 40
MDYFIFQNTNSAGELTLPTPEILISEILEQQQDSTLNLEQLLEKIYERIGIPWSKSYKSKCGSINQFLNSHCSHFFLEGSELQATVTLIGDPKSVNMENGDDKPSPSHRGRQWFNFNDMEVLPVNEEDMEKFFEGEESAYMLVYRRKSLQRPEAAVANPAYAIPLHIQDWVDQVNQQNEAER